MQLFWVTYLCHSPNFETPQPTEGTWEDFHDDVLDIWLKARNQGAYWWDISQPTGGNARIFHPELLMLLKCCILKSLFFSLRLNEKAYSMCDLLNKMQPMNCVLWYAESIFLLLIQPLANYWTVKDLPGPAHDLDIMKQANRSIVFRIYRNMCVPK